MAEQAEREALRSRWPAEFNDGARCGLLQKYDGQRESGGFPTGFHRWKLDRRNAWYSGFSLGLHDRLRHEAARAHG